VTPKKVMQPSNLPCRFQPNQEGLQFPRLRALEDPLVNARGAQVLVRLDQVVALIVSLSSPLSETAVSKVRVSVSVRKDSTTGITGFGSLFHFYRLLEARGSFEL
jgi:hypothetical protein